MLFANAAALNSVSLDAMRSSQIGMTARYNFVLPDKAADSVNSSADSRSPSGWDTTGDAGERDRFVLQEVDDVIRGCFAFHVRGQGKNDLRNFVPIDAIDQFFNPQVLGSDMVERRNLAAERMISTAKCTGFFQRKNVGWLFCDAEHFSRSRRVGADVADFGGSKEPAQIAGMDRLPRVRNGARNLLRLIVPRVYHPECNPLRRARTDSRHLPQLRD